MVVPVRRATFQLRGFVCRQVHGVSATLRYWSVRALAWLAQRLPLRFSYWVADRVGDFIYLTWHRGRASAIDNFRHVLGEEVSEEEVRLTARRSFRTFHRAMVDFLRLPRVQPDEALRLIEGRGWEHLDRALAQGKGVILVGTHFGNWDLAGMVLAARNYRVNAVADGFSSEKLEQWVRRNREARGVHIIRVGTYALRHIYRALQRNEAVGIIVDRPAGPEGVPVRFFGHWTRWPRGPAVLALRTGAPVLAGYLVQRPDGSFTGEIRPVPGLATGQKAEPSEERVQALTQAMVELFEDCIRRYPDQWYMFRRMWPAQQPGNRAPFRN
jgi:KDO2-lipid IV(A) lauroyltransferase